MKPPASLLKAIPARTYVRFKAEAFSPQPRFPAGSAIKKVVHHLLYGTSTRETAAAEAKGLWLENPRGSELGRLSQGTAGGFMRALALASFMRPSSKPVVSSRLLSAAAIEMIELIPKVDGGKYLFPNTSDPTKHLTTIKHAWQTARAEAKLPDTRIHDLRHTFASSAIDAGFDLHSLGKVLGHQSHASTARYSHVSNSRLMAIVEAGAANLKISAAAA